MLVSQDYPYLPIKVTVRNFSSPFQALLDTGFDGHLVLPEILGNQLGNPDHLVKTRLADGTEKALPAYLGV
jgi:predicted aspartyl protease